MREVELSEIATKVPTLNYDLSIVEVKNEACSFYGKGTL